MQKIEDKAVRPRSRPAEVGALAWAVRAFCETVDAALRYSARPRGGQQVDSHGDFCNSPPSTLNALRHWAQLLREAETPAGADGLEARIRADERERCAEIAEAWAAHYPTSVWPESSQHPEAMAAAGERHASRAIAYEIRKRGKA